MFRRWVWALASLLLASCDKTKATHTHERELLITGNIENIDPRFTLDPQGLRMSRMLFAGLVKISEKGNVQMDLAESIGSTDGQTWRVVLSQKTFSDGTPVTCHDVKATIDSVIGGVSANGIVKTSPFARVYGNIEHMDILDDMHCNFRLKEPHAPFLTDLELPVLRAKDTERVLNFADKSWASSGSYHLVASDKGNVTLKHRKTGDALRVSVVGDEQVRLMRLIKNPHALSLQFSPALSQYFSNAGYTGWVQSRGGLSTQYIAINTKKPCLKENRTRHQLDAWLDKRALVIGKMAGQVLPAEGLIPLGHWAYRELPQTHLTELRGTEFNSCHFVLRVADQEDKVSLAHSIAWMWEEHGVQVDVKTSDYATFVADLAHGQFDFALLTFPEMIEPHVLEWFFASYRTPEVGGGNRMGYQNKQVDHLFKEGSMTMDKTLRAQIYQRIHQTIMEDRPVMVLWHNKSFVYGKEAAMHPPRADARWPF